MSNRQISVEIMSKTSKFQKISTNDIERNDDLVTVSFDDEERYGHGQNALQIEANSPLVMSSPNRWMSNLTTLTSKFWVNNPRLSTFFLVCLVLTLPFALISITLWLRLKSEQYYVDENYIPVTPWLKFRATSTSAAVASDVGACSNLGVKIMEMGGNAVDAAVSVALCVGALNPASSGMGGGCFILTYNSTSQTSEFIDSREIAPTGSHSAMFAANPMAAQTGGLAVAVLGEVRGLYLAWSRHGSQRLTWREIVEPVAALAQEVRIRPLTVNTI